MDQTFSEYMHVPCEQLIDRRHTKYMGKQKATYTSVLQFILTIHSHIQNNLIFLILMGQY